jgi:hypothetical protein
MAAATQPEGAVVVGATVVVVGLVVVVGAAVVVVGFVVVVGAAVVVVGFVVVVGATVVVVLDVVVVDVVVVDVDLIVVEVGGSVVVADVTSVVCGTIVVLWGFLGGQGGGFLRSIVGVFARRVPKRDSKNPTEDSVACVVDDSVVLGHEPRRAVAPLYVAVETATRTNAAQISAPRRARVTAVRSSHVRRAEPDVSER